MKVGRRRNSIPLGATAAIGASGSTIRISARPTLAPVSSSPGGLARLVTSHPRPAVAHPGWELPGINQHQAEVSPLLALPEQRATRLSIRHHVVPDWQAVAGQYDAIHLSWAGFITSEGCIVDLGDGDVTMLRYWFSEHTTWLADVFGQPSSAPDTHINLATGNHWPPLPPRTTVDSNLIVRLLGRPPSTG